MFVTMLLVDFFNEDWLARCCELYSQDRYFRVLTGDYHSLPVGAKGLAIGAEVIDGDGWTIRRNSPGVPVDKWLERSDERVDFEIIYLGVSPPSNGIGAYNLVLPPGWRFDVVKVGSPNSIGGDNCFSVARDNEGNREAVMLYFQGANSQFKLEIQAARGSIDSDSRDLGAQIYPRRIVEPIPADLDRHSEPEDASTQSKPTIVPPSKPLQADATSGEKDAAQAGQGGKLSPVPGVRPETEPATPNDQALADEIATKNPFDAADELAALPSSQAAHILTLMNPKSASGVLANLEDDTAREILTSLESDTVVAMLNSPVVSDNTVRIIELTEPRLAAATLSKMQELNIYSGGMVLRKMKPQPAAAIIDAMTRGELDRAQYFATGLDPDPLYRLIDYVSIGRILYLISRISVDRAAGLLEIMVQRSSERADELLWKMEPGLDRGIFGKMDIDIARDWITRMDAASATRLLEIMPPTKAAILRKSIERPDED
jgi:flagellar motility protein MotE (MotC chaperone)